MNNIVSIKPLKGEQASITIQTATATIPHITTMNMILRHHLEVGQTLSDDQYNRFIKDNEYEVLYLTAVNYISYQMRTISEVKKKLSTKTKDEALIQRIIDELKQHQYLGDVRYVEEYVNEKLNYDLVGPIYIKDKLIQKGIHYDLIDVALVSFTKERQYQKVEELLQKELKYPPKKPYLKFAESFKRKCINKGFSLSVVDSLLLSFKDQIIESIDEDQLIQRELKQFKKQAQNYEETQKRIQSLRRKGYSFAVIQKYLS